MQSLKGCGVCLLLCIGLPAIAPAGEGLSEGAAEKPPNILFIMIDTLRRDHVGCYGYPRETTPQLDRFAKEGARFEQMIATSSWTMPSLMSMFTGLPPSLHQATTLQRKLRDGVPTLAGELKKAGYVTAAIVSNPVASSKFGFGAGFDVYDDYTCTLTNDLLPDDAAKKAPSKTASSPVVNRCATLWLEQKRDRNKPFFLFLLYIDVHAEYLPPAPYDTIFDPDYSGDVDTKGDFRGVSERDRKHIQALYDGEIRYVDEHVGQILNKLNALGLSKDTLVVIGSDHGEEFWEHGKTHHGHSLFDELVRVPFMVRWPRKIQPGLVVKPQHSVISMMPTLLAAANIKPPALSFGKSFLDPLLGKGAFEEQIVFMETEVEGKNLRAARREHSKVIWDVALNKRYAFNLDEDASEINPLIVSSTAPLINLTREFDAWLQGIESGMKQAANPGRPELRAKLLEQLKDMGYSQ